MQQPVTPSFDTWTSLFLLVSSFGFFLSVILSIRKNNRSNNLPIILLVLGFSCILLYYVLIWTNYKYTYRYLYFFDTTWYLTFGPLLYSYITRFYNNIFRIKWYHFVPAIACFIINAYYFVQSNGFQNLTEHKDESLYYFFRVVNLPWLAALSFIIYLITIKDFISFHKTNKRSQYEVLRDKWSTFLLCFFFVFALSYISYYVLVRFSFFSIHWDYAISFSMSLAIYAIGYTVYKEPSIFNGELLSNLFLKESSLQEFTEATKEEFYSKLLSYISVNKPYLDNNLRLVQLADKVGFSSHTLSKIINEKANKNFNQFINEYRLQEAEKLLLEDSSISIKTIYFDVGFNNKATFNTAFKNKFNCTPSEYKKKYLAIQDR
ncbi:helix-turn-helix domain-containing protein [Aquimarina sp. 2201CG5-10]|uniref:AraC family transcriptional regulator n=1 Tax=Aquimarina callyspongiae TaxID=3098150 RepID=UPI002AB56716|nr:helix-turn-helix domain-containing protein [Aquimarina sp. 2201CG5-10]MDY8138832.1 helix-turn-helix domain-containing protein [Aquimarina sp. 2201CG5-10]